MEKNKTVSVGRHRSRIQSIAVSGNNVHVFEVKCVLSLHMFFIYCLIFSPTLQRRKRERRIRSSRTGMGRYGEKATSRGKGESKRITIKTNAHRLRRDNCVFLRYVESSRNDEASHRNCEYRENCGGTKNVGRLHWW